LRYSIAGGLDERFAQRHHRELEREAACLNYALFHKLGQLAEMRVAGRQFRPSVADTNDRFPFEFFVGDTLFFHPGAVNKTVFAIAAEPVAAAEIFFGKLMRTY
jgi:hypothetical protein